MPAHICLTADQLERDLGIRDLSDPAEGPHAMQLLTRAAVDALATAWDCEVRWCRGPRVVSVADNYDRLGFDPGTVTRDARYTRYVDDAHLLRSHSSAMIPPALRALATDAAGNHSPDDVLLVCPGIVFRRDAIDWQHTGTPHQLDLWRITCRAQPMTGADMDEMVALLCRTLLGDRPYRQEARVHPYTLDGRQVDALYADAWVEVAECGLAHPAVLSGAGLQGWTGLALGMGLDRLLMLVKGIGDIRLLRSSDPRIASQMTDLGEYREVSSMPPVVRDLSIAVPEGDDDETLGDRVRDSLGPRASVVEQVTVLSATPYEELPAAAVARLGAEPGQKNVLVRIVLRDLTRTLTDAEANELRDLIYGALHRGTEHQWAIPGQ